MRLFTLLFLIVGLLSCQSPTQENAKTTEVAASQDPGKEAVKGWVTDGNLESDTILLICSGGPKWGLDIEKKGKTNYRYIPRYSEYGIAYVHQAQTLDDRIFNSETVISLADAQQAVKKNTELLDEAIRFFKGKEKTVIVIGKSHGAYVVQDYLATQTPMADKYFILAGRLSMNEEMTQQQLRGYNGEFADDGLTYLPEDENADLSDYPEEEIRQYQNKQLLKAGYGVTDYTLQLAEVDLSKVTYVYGTKDQNIGRLTAQEVEFLERKNVTVIETAADHSGVNYAFIDGLEDGSIQF